MSGLGNGAGSLTDSVTVGASLTGFDRNLMRATSILGAKPLTGFLRVMLPLILPGVLSGAAFAFVTSFDEVVVVQFLASAEQRLDEIKFEPLLSVRADTDQKEVFELFDKYNLRSLAVVDEAHRPIGAITVDDVVSRMHAKI